MTRILLLLLTLCLLAPGAARASTTIGTDPDAVLGGDPIVCGGGCTVAQAELSGLDQDVREDGVVTRLRIRGAGGTAKLRRITPRGDGTLTGGAATAAVTLTGANQTVPVSLAVREGDYLGIELSPGARIDADESFFDSNRLVVWSPALAEGQTRPISFDPLGWAAYEATIEPDADGDGLGDDSQDSCVFCRQPPPPDDGRGGGAPAPTPPAPPAPSVPSTPAKPTPVQRATDPYADIRKAGPKVTFAPTVQRKGGTVTVTVSNPYAFAVSGKLAVKRGRKTVGTKTLKLAAKATKKVKLKVRGVPKKLRRLALAATVKGPVGKSATTKASVKIGKAVKPKGTTAPTQDGGGSAPAGGGVDGTYRGASGGDAGWTMVIEGGVVQSFNGTLSLSCTKGGGSSNHPFTMLGDDAKPTVGPDGAFAWEATAGYGLTKLKFSGKVSGNQVTGNAVVEYRPPVNGISPVTGLPRFEFDYCFAGRDYTLAR
jgi:hypothetical protein